MAVIHRFDQTEPKTGVMGGVVPRRARPGQATRDSVGRIVMCDGENSSRSMVADILRADGYDVTETRDGGELLQVVLTWHPDLVLADSRMPGALAQLRAAGGSVPVIVITPAGEDLRGAAAALGAAAAFARPVDVDDLRTAVLNLAASKKAARAIAQPRVSSAIEATLSRCIFVLRDVAAERAHALIGASALRALRLVIETSTPSAAQRTAADALAAAFVRFEEAQSRGSGIIARYDLELAALRVLESGGWRR